jgi:hypothetical protein
MILNSVILALLLNAFSGTDAEDQPANSKVVESTVEKNLPRNEQPSESDTIRHNGAMVGPSAQEIHDFLYPMPKDVKVVRPAN